MNPIDMSDYDEELANLLPEEQLGAPALSPDLAQARADRDKEIADSYVMQGLTQIGAGLAGQKADVSSYIQARQAAQNKANEVKDDALLRSKAVSDAIKARQLQEKAKSDEDWRRANFEQRDRAIEATRLNQEAARNKPSDANNLAAGYGARMQQAEPVFDDLDSSGYDRASKKSAIESKLTGLGGGVGDIASAFIQSEGGKKQEQAERNFLSAVLRRESGASISPTEREEGAAQYFPRVGDSPEVKAQKKANRMQAMESLRASAGPAWNQTARVPPAMKTKVVNGVTYVRVPGGWKRQ